MHKRAQKYRNQITYILAGVVILLTFLITACSATTIQPELTPISHLFTPTPTNSSYANPSSTPLLPQKLRISNQSSFTIHDLYVRFPDERVEFRDVLPGVTTDYQVVSLGVYRYAAYDVVVDGQEYQQPVVDWMGESPMNGNAFTYILDVDPARWKTEGQVIRLVEVKKDQ
jgi:hypothetical protein